MIASSLTVRTIIAGIIWISLALGIGGGVIFNVFSVSASQQFDVRLEAHLDLLTAALAGSSASPERRMGAPDFNRIFSGLYWQAIAEGGPAYRSRSLWDSELVFEMNGETEARLGSAGPDGQTLRLLARKISGQDQVQWTLAVAADTTTLVQNVDEFRRTLLTSAAVLALALLGAAILMLRAALSPLKTLRKAVLERHVNDGEQITGNFPSEVEPLVDDLNMLLERNERLREKGRVQAANLAHALKTPAAILRNELTTARRGGEVNIALAEEAVEKVSAAADRHLSLVTAGPDDMLPSGRTDIVQVAEETIRALKRLFAGRTFKLVAPDALAISLSRPEQLELLGNLIENAGKWSTDKIIVTIKPGDRETLVVVEDDGAGVPKADRARILKQGVRLDEAKGGSGLGLTIVGDIVERHQGSLQLQQSELGGLRVCVAIPEQVRSRTS